MRGTDIETNSTPRSPERVASTRTHFVSWLHSFIIVSRYEFVAAGLFFLLTVSALASGTFQEMWSNRELVLWGSMMWFLSHMVGSQINCIADYDLDRLYKIHLAKAVDRLGRPVIWIFLATESLVAFLLTLHMAVLTDKFVLPVLWVFGWLVTIGYSVEPLRFKRRGLLNPIALILVLYILPVSYGYIALRDDLNITLVSLLAGVGLQILSLILMNSVEDVPEDRSQGIETPTVRYGLKAVSATALVLFVVGGMVSFNAFLEIIGSPIVSYVFVGIGAILQLLVARDLFRIATVSVYWQVGGGRKNPPLTVVRKIGGRNSLHFAILGLTLGIGSVLSLS